MRYQKRYKNIICLLKILTFVKCGTFCFKLLCQSKNDIYRSNLPLPLLLINRAKLAYFNLYALNMNNAFPIFCLVNTEGQGEERIDPYLCTCICVTDRHVHCGSSIETTVECGDLVSCHFPS